MADSVLPTMRELRSPSTILTKLARASRASTASSSTEAARLMPATTNRLLWDSSRTISDMASTPTGSRFARTGRWCTLWRSMSIMASNTNRL